MVNSKIVIKILNDFRVRFIYTSYKRTVSKEHSDTVRTMVLMLVIFFVLSVYRCPINVSAAWLNKSVFLEQITRVFLHFALFL